MTCEISVAVCTYHRPVLLEQCLESLCRQDTTRSFEIIVVDNDLAGSAREVVCRMEKLANARGVELRYAVEPVQNISMARNRAVRLCAGRYVAFIDDDEFASEDWLELMRVAIDRCGGDGVFGPVVPIFPQAMPEWMRKSVLFLPVRWKDGQVMPWGATGNALVVRSVLSSRPGPFREAFGRTGGGDGDLFRWLARTGYRLFWCAQASVYETQEDKRCHLSWHIRRAYRYGWNFAKWCDESRGAVRGRMFVLLLMPLALAKGCLMPVLRLRSFRAAALDALLAVISQVGKIGFYLGVSVEEYRGGGS